MIKNIRLTVKFNSIAKTIEVLCDMEINKEMVYLYPVGQINAMCTLDVDSVEYLRFNFVPGNRGT